MTIHYVAGYGRSGSTTLGRVIAAREGAVVLGEIAALAEAGFVDSATCSCGHVFAECPFWSAVSMRLGRSDGGVALPSMGIWQGWAGLVVPMAILRRLVTTRRHSDDRPGVSFRDGVQAMLVTAEGGLVDTSKTTRQTANRPRLLRASGADLDLWLPTRPVRDVVASHRAAQVRRGRAGGWARSAMAVVPNRLLAFLSARWTAVLLGVRIRRSPLAQTVKALDDLDSHQTAEHLIAGNRSRHEEL